MRWRCRRGMKELDLLLDRFLAQAFDEVSDERLDLLERFLEAPDQDLLACLTGEAEPDDEDLVQFGRWMRTRIAFEPEGSTSPAAALGTQRRRCGEEMGPRAGDADLDADAPGLRAASRPAPK